jgi:hypothetical protein
MSDVIANTIVGGKGQDSHASSAAKGVVSSGFWRKRKVIEVAGELIRKFPLKFLQLTPIEITHGRHRLDPLD